MASPAVELMQSAKPVAFIYVSDRARALAFYQDALELMLHSSDEFGDFIQLGGALLRVTVMPEYKVSSHPVLGWNVSDIRAAIEVLGARGVRFATFPGMNQDKHGIWTSPDGQTKVAFFADPDGNVLTISQV